MEKKKEEEIILINVYNDDPLLQISKSLDTVTHLFRCKFVTLLVMLFIKV